MDHETIKHKFISKNSKKSISSWDHCCRGVQFGRNTPLTVIFCLYSVSWVQRPQWHICFLPRYQTNDFNPTIDTADHHGHTDVFLNLLQMSWSSFITVRANVPQFERTSAPSWSLKIFQKRWETPSFPRSSSNVEKKTSAFMKVIQAAGKTSAAASYFFFSGSITSH